MGFSIKFALALIGMAIVLAGCAGEPARKVDLSKIERNKAIATQNGKCLGCKTSRPFEDQREQTPHWVRTDMIRVAISGMIVPRETLGFYEELLKYVGIRLAKRVELVQRRTYQEVNDLVESGLVDVAFVCSLPYVLGRDNFGMELLVAPQVNGETLYYSYIIARTDSVIDSLEELRGKTFAFMDPDSNTGTLYPTYRLAQLGEQPGNFFHHYLYTYGHDNSVKAVLNKLADGAAVDSLVFDYMAARDRAVGTQIKVVEKSPPFGIPPVVVHPGLDPNLKEQLRRVFLDMDKDEMGKGILSRMGIDRFILPSDGAYDSIRVMYYMLKAKALESRR